MATAADVKKFALSLPGVTEVDHFGRSSFRTMKRIFAVIRPDGLNLMVPDERKEFLFNAAPDVFVKKMWGKRSYMVVQLGKIAKGELDALIREAHEAAMPPNPGGRRRPRPNGVRSPPLARRHQAPYN